MVWQLELYLMALHRFDRAIHHKFLCSIYAIIPNTISLICFYWNYKPLAGDWRLGLENGNTVYHWHRTSACRRANGFNSFSVIRMLVQEHPVVVANPSNFHLSELHASFLIQIAISQGSTIKMFIEICIVHKCIFNKHSCPFVESAMV